MRNHGNFKLRNIFFLFYKFYLFKALFINYDEINLLLLSLHLTKIGEWSLYFKIKIKKIIPFAQLYYDFIPQFLIDIEGIGLSVSYRESM